MNIVDAVLEVHRDPQPASAAEYGAVYGVVEMVRAPATVTPLGAPAARIRVGSLLPPFA